MRRRSQGAPPPQPIRVLFLADHLGYPAGPMHGVATYFETVIPALVAAGIEATAAVMGPYHDAALRLRARGVAPVFFASRRYDPTVLSRLARLARERHIAIIHAANLKAQFLGRLVAARYGLRVILHIHDTQPLPWHARLLERAVARFTDLAIGVSDAAAEIAVRDYGIPCGKVVTLPNAVPLERFAQPAPDARLRLEADLGLAPTARIVAQIGRLHARKGADHAIRALPALLRLVPDAVLVFFGTGDQRPALEALARAEGVAAAVRFAGQRSDIPDLLGAIDVVVMPSLWGEGLPYAAIEALAAGCPVVAYPDAGIPSVVVPERTGLLVEKGDLAGLAAGLARILDEPGLRPRLAAGARAHARRFAIEEHIARLIGYYRQVLGMAQGEVPTDPTMVLHPS